MKKLRKIYIIFSILIVSSCDFLDGGVKGIVDNGKMFSNEQGFIDAMSGVYASMTNAGLYGENLSFGLIDEFAQLYYNNRESYETTLTKTIDLKYKDADVKSRIDEVWEVGYNVISSANSIIDNAAKYHYPSVPRIKAEALAVRAYIHFDMLQLFAPGYNRRNEKGIPYVKHFTDEPVFYSTVGEVYDAIVSDLKEAMTLLKDSPKIPSEKNVELHLNYYSVAAILARVENWAGKHKESEKYALEALKGGYEFTYIEKVKGLFKGYTAYKECVFGLQAPKMYLSVRKKLTSNKLSDETDMVRSNFKEIFSLNTFTASSNDYRYQAYFTQRKWGSGTVAFTKLYDQYYDEHQNVTDSRIPGINLIRIPELYYILAESVYDEDKSKALMYLNQVVTARGLRPLPLAAIADKPGFEKVLVNEIVKEFWGEGRIFFTYKRFQLNMEGVDGKVHKASDEVYILPVPENEKEEGL